MLPWASAVAAKRVDAKKVEVRILMTDIRPEGLGISQEEE